MRRRPLLAFALILLVAGCLGIAPQSMPTETRTPAQATASPTATPTGSVSVEYLIRAGTIPDDFRSVTVTMRVVFVEQPSDMGPCWYETFYGPYKPTPTPIGRPSGDCHRSTPVTVDLTELDGERSLGRVTAPGSFTAGHALIVTNVTATYQNGTAVTGIRGASGKRAAVVEGRPHGQHAVTFSIEAYEDRDYDYWFVAERA